MKEKVGNGGNLLRSIFYWVVFLIWVEIGGIMMCLD